MSRLTEGLDPLPALAREPGEAAGEAYTAAVHRWQEAIDGLEEPLRRQCAALADDAAGRAVLDRVFAFSPFLSAIATADPAFTLRIFSEGADAGVRLARDELAAAVNGGSDGGPPTTDGLMRALRQARRRTALAIALADIAGAWRLDQVTAALSDFASEALRLACRHLLGEMAASGLITPGDPAQPDAGSGLVVLGMGKLGARELNYSSDVDLIVLYDDEAIASPRPDELQAAFVRLARGLVRIMQEATRDGYVMRMDLRLRPDPAATPLAVSVHAAETYYESLGQNWERAAMIKARPVAGDIEAGERFLAHLRPFMWRRHLDFAAIQDIHSIKRQINAHRGGQTLELDGHNVKLGRGGIREIEFFAQTQQLIWGGRDATVRQAPTREALHALATAGRVLPLVAVELGGAYELLRRVEHRLQMIDDQQTHSLPATAAGRARLARFMGYGGTDGPARFDGELLAALQLVERRFGELFQDAPELGRGAGDSTGPDGAATVGNLVFTGSDDDPDTLATLADLGFDNPVAVSGIIRGWHHGRYRAMRSARARELLTELTPTLLQSLAGTVHPSGALANFDSFLGRLPAGVQLFSMFAANPSLLSLVVDIMGDAPRLAETLSRNPGLIDAMLSGDFFAPPGDRAILESELAVLLKQAADYEDVLGIVRRWANERKFQVGVQVLRGRSVIDQAGRHYTHIAEAALNQLQPAVEAEFSRQHGHVPGGGFAIVAMGKLGSGELSPTSDIDLTFVYDAPPDVTASDGPKPLSPSHYYARFAQRVIAAITALTGDGRLYEIDMRLRPSGNAGPIASSLEAFTRYYGEAAWTWEHMALTQARALTGPDPLRRAIDHTIRQVLTRPRDGNTLRHDIADMRQRVARQHPPRGPWSPKYGAGGLMDLEFIAQFLMLAHGHAHAEVLGQGTADTFIRLGEAGVLPPATAQDLADTHRLWRAVQAILRLTMDRPFDPDAAPASVRTALTRATQSDSFDHLATRLSQATERARTVFMSLIGEPDDDAIKPNEEKKP